MRRTSRDAAGARLPDLCGGGRGLVSGELRGAVPGIHPDALRAAAAAAVLRPDRRGRRRAAGGARRLAPGAAAAAGRRGRGGDRGLLRRDRRVLDLQAPVSGPGAVLADPALADLDAALHGGAPWSAAHALLPAAAEPVLFFLYGPVWFSNLARAAAGGAFLTCDDLRQRYLVAFAGTLMVLGTVGMVAGASAGPIFYDRMLGGTRFAELTAALGARPYGAAMLRASDIPLRRRTGATMRSSEPASRRCRACTSRWRC